VYIIHIASYLAILRKTCLNTSKKVKNSNEGRKSINVVLMIECFK